ncbi:MAG: Druantia anti-phage system protein DruA [Burkholderiaceae bacterium]
MSVYCGREFSPDDIQTIRDLMHQHPTLKRSPLSRKLCELWNWTKPNGELKDMTCRVALSRLQAAGLITLAPSQIPNARRRAHFAATAATDAQTPIKQPVHELANLTLRLVTGAAQSHRWNEYVARYHYLGYTPMSGSQLRYNVLAGEQLVALISFGASAWKLKPRELFIGWQEPERLRNLQLIVNNARFLILPWIESKGLASKILAKIARQLPHDWHQRYGYRPVLLETFVESERHRGTCYKAANWINIGQTTGRGKKSTGHQQIVPIKDIWLYPLRNNFASLLCA